MHMQKQFLLIAMILSTATLTTAQAVSGCQDHCGDLTIPFPFGTKEGCYLNKDFLITCNASTSEAFLGDTQIQVLNISVEGQLRISTTPAYDCYDQSGNTLYSESTLELGRFPISYTKNKLTAIGCDTNAYIQGLRAKGMYATGCISYCEQMVDIVNGSCNGIGCCQSSIPKEVLQVYLDIGSFYNHTYVLDFNPCSYAFVVEESAYNFSTLDLGDLRDVVKFPVLLDWAIGNETCDDALTKPEDYACKANNTVCVDSDNGPGYRCNCSQGFSGNPYLPNGCKDINECEIPSLNQCTHSCQNKMGNYTCYCPKGYYGDGRKDGSGCTRKQTISTQTGAIIGVSISLVLLFLAISTILGMQRKSVIKSRKEHFKQNGGLLLQQTLFKSKNSTDAAKIFAEAELKKATNNFNKDMVIGQGGYGVVFKGILSENKREVAIKKSKAIDRTQIEQFVNEVIVVSQIHHPNIVKLLGCCLETPVPLLVYDFITNGTLFHHLHDSAFVHSLPWEVRLRIAEETAKALAYMHSMQIVHRDVKSANILLDNDFTAKVSDFGVSRLVPFNQEQIITTLVQGTLGYMDPEYFQTGILTEKSDVYSFGVVLVELLTGKKAIFSECEQKSLALYFISSLRDKSLFNILEYRVKEEGNAQQLERVAKLAQSCLKLQGEKRPTMKEVAEELEISRQQGKQSQTKLQFNFQDQEYLTL
ncbi:hypothetical protein JCGZ_12187 [Jatropha curcas]|uniref:Protein kinase domain-containing protein n=1 Tax=Jatropha curcas TaxID=180498 RepID=A0A067KKU2_JATCU|nr:wall-associated receptor kinase 2 [Jatropha curcas]KDP32895.1 hypothetical protein JCGZ_12187 [Jatropha curcas]